jgi:hypothetical protein
MNIPIGQIKMFVVTGKDRSGKRFKIESSSYSYVCMINIYNGSVWAVLDSGKRKLIKRVYN